MIVYHFAWDLSFYRFIAVDVTRDPLWSRFAEAIAASFLFLVGVGFAFAARDGLKRDRYLKRLATIAGAAALVTLSTALAMPDAPVLFGILHCIALVSALILPFLRSPLPAVAAAAAAVLVLPFVARSSFFDHGWWTWLGLARTVAPAVDYAPLLPWSGFALLGLAAGRLVLSHDAMAALRLRIRAWSPGAFSGRLLVAMGRWSLVIYLLHQPVLMALLWPFAPAAPPIARIDDAQGFRNACEQTCRASGAPAQPCAAYCDCAVLELRPTPLWSSILRDRVTPDEQTRIGDLMRRCAPAAQ
jgi:uncharacterized membrane protein